MARAKSRAIATKSTGLVKKKPGPVSKNTITNRLTIIKALQECMPFTFACDIAGVDRDSGYRWMKETPEFAAQVRVAKAKAIKGLVSLTAQQAGGWKLLKNLGREEFKETVSIEQKSELTLVLDTGQGDADYEL